MSNIIEVDNLKKLTHKKIHEGLNGSCYLTKDNYVFKQLNKPDEKKLKQLSRFYSTHFVFPRVLVYSKDGKLLGYIMEYVHGNTLDRLPVFVSLENYRTELDRVEREIKVLTCYRLYLLDMGKTNILYSTKDGMSVLDTDFYVPDSKSKRLYSDNMKQFVRGAMYPFGELSEMHFKSDKLNKYSKFAVDGMMTPSSFIFELEEESRRKGFDRPESIRELRKQMKFM